VIWKNRRSLDLDLDLDLEQEYVCNLEESGTGVGLSFQSLDRSSSVTWNKSPSVIWKVQEEFGFGLGLGTRVRL
jgi:hypothetical protein